MKQENKNKAVIRLRDAEEFIKSAEENLEKERYKASLDHSVDAAIAATAIVNGADLCTLNQKHFLKIPNLELFEI